VFELESQKQALMKKLKILEANREKQRRFRERKKRRNSQGAIEVATSSSSSIVPASSTSDARIVELLVSLISNDSVDKFQEMLGRLHLPVAEQAQLLVKFFTLKNAFQAYKRRNEDESIARSMLTTQIMVYASR
jgi:hypothetical protein